MTGETKSGMKQVDQQLDAQLDLELTAALERRPEPCVPADFAVHVAASAANMPAPHTRHAVSYGTVAGILCAIVVLLTMFLLVPFTRPGFSSIGFDVELLLAAQLIVISWWLTAHRKA